MLYGLILLRLKQNKLTLAKSAPLYLGHSFGSCKFHVHQIVKRFTKVHSNKK